MRRILPICFILFLFSVVAAQAYEVIELKTHSLMRETPVCDGYADSPVETAITGTNVRREARRGSIEIFMVVSLMAAAYWTGYYHGGKSMIHTIKTACEARAKGCRPGEIKNP